MFDKYNMQQDDSHGDIIFWPLKALSEYISSSSLKYKNPLTTSSFIAYFKKHSLIPIYINMF